MPPKRKWELDVNLDDAPQGVRRVKGPGTYEADSHRMKFFAYLYENEDATVETSAGGRNRISIHFDTLIPDSDPKWEFHQGEFQTIVDNKGEDAVRTSILKLHSRGFDNATGDQTSG